VANLRTGVFRFAWPSAWEKPRKQSARSRTEPNQRARCDFCRLTLQTMPALILHMKLMHKEASTLTCDVCQAVLLCKTHMYSHIKVHLKDKRKREKPIFKRRPPIPNFTWPKVWEKPKKRRQQTTRCHICRTKFPKVSEMLQHMRRVHKDAAPLKCDLCQVERVSRAQMRSHLGVHMQVERMKGVRTCKLCGLRFRTLAILRKHFEEKHGPRNKCDICGRAYKFHCQLKEHMRVHSDERPFTCDNCGHRFKARATVKAHMYTHLSIPHQCTCEVCGKTFRMRHHLEQHLKICKSERVKNFCCNICDFKTHSRASLRNHLLTHSDARNFSCEECGASFKSKNGLTSHKKFHKGRKFPCTVCGTELRSKGSLGRHIKQHQDLREHVCNVCGFAFVQLENLRVHQYKQHQILIYKCDKCEERFRLKADMKQHRIEVHFQK